MNKIYELLKFDTQEIQQGFAKASLEGAGTPQEISDRREIILSSFIKKYFPFPFRVTKGNIIDSYEKNSQSIDCVVLNPNHPYLTNNGSQFSAILADGVEIAIELKPDLNSVSEIERSLQQIISVKKLRKVNSTLIPFTGYTKLYEIEVYKRIPCVIFSNSTYANIETLLTKISNYYIEQKTPQILQFDMIVINQSWVIINSNKVNYNSVFNYLKNGLYAIQSDDYTLALFLTRINLYKNVNFMDANILKHYLKKDINEEFMMYTYPNINDNLMTLPPFDIEIDMIKTI